MTKGEKLEQRYVNASWGEVESCIMGRSRKLDLDKKGATLKNGERSKFLDKRSTQVGGAKLMNFDWLHLICAYSCA